MFLDNVAYEELLGKSISIAMSAILLIGPENFTADKIAAVGAIANPAAEILIDLPILPVIILYNEFVMSKLGQTAFPTNAPTRYPSCEPITSETMGPITFG